MLFVSHANSPSPADTSCRSWCYTIVAHFQRRSAFVFSETYNLISALPLLKSRKKTQVRRNRTRSEQTGRHLSADYAKFMLHLYYSDRRGKWGSPGRYVSTIILTSVLDYGTDSPLFSIRIIKTNNKIGRFRWHGWKNWNVDVWWHLQCR